ncbi:enolase C-terminal domain-like protein [Sphingomonas quercus]|uniref:Bifunctional D-altronate/D-mannonate dehydratase n=1 Tax=Sphingomonas quercus TaxID=2842451 RepID=A0ABS6BL70_9SPHN|nr:enolase C-terminal domain-like protein [Sphingomonas quercus]MBU3079038.1 bifunctional D-altronate/D-mannonate dehydratase [Sphingomonas quercus]
MNRRELIRSMVASGAALLATRTARAQNIMGNATRGMATPVIKDISVINTAPEGVRLCVVKITTDQPGLYGYGCATFTQRADLIEPAVVKYLKPLLVGHPVDRIEDTWQAAYASSYWRNGPVENNAISGVDQALWDIKGRMASMPVYELLGGKAREAADAYVHAEGAEIENTIENSKRFMAEGFRHIRIQVGLPGMAGYGSQRGGRVVRIPALHDKPVFEREAAKRRAFALFEAARKELGDEVELIHDMHERYNPAEAVQFCKDAEKFRFFFVEDPVSPEDIEWFRNIRAQTTAPLAMGELFNSPHEWTPLIKDRLIDFMRMHISQMGGLTPARKVAAMGEIFGVRTAWHGPGDVSPIGHAAMLHLDLSISNFGIQEWTPFNAASQEIFHGCPTIKDGYIWANDRPGWGIEIDEKAAARYPFKPHPLNAGWGEVRLPDGQIVKQ